MTNPFKNNKKLKVAVYSLLTAATFWFFNAMTNRYTTIINFPVEYTTEDGLQLVSSDNDILVSVSGTGWNIIGNQLGIKVSPLKIKLVNPGEWLINTDKYTSQIRSGLVSVELKDVITDELKCEVAAQ
ncbi:hypothetical protein OAH12_00545 [Cyclobacteriaceae bacterium]|nr:hypothetical protein [Cyclobacteriaceae bacterium]